MGRIFFHNLGGSIVVACRRCRVYLTNRSELFSENFQGATGPAFLFNRAWNVDFSEMENREMLTGKHYVRDVLCRNCKAKLGWMYEFACEDSQRYKESKVILEKALIEEYPGMIEGLGEEESVHRQPVPPIIETNAKFVFESDDEEEEKEKKKKKKKKVKPSTGSETSSPSGSRSRRVRRPTATASSSRSSTGQSQREQGDNSQVAS